MAERAVAGWGNQWFRGGSSERVRVLTSALGMCSWPSARSDVDIFAQHILRARISAAAITAAGAASSSADSP